VHIRIEVTSFSLARWQHSTLLRERTMTSWPPSWNFDVKSKKFDCVNRCCVNPVKFHPDPIWNDGASGFFEDGRPNKKKNNNKMI